MTVSPLAPSWVSRPIFWKRHDWKSTIRCRSNTPGWSLRPRTRLYLRYGSGGGPRSSCFLGRGVLCPSLIEACPWSATWWATLDISGAEYISADWLPDGAPAVLAAPSPSGTSVEPAPSRPHPVLPVARPSLARASMVLPTIPGHPCLSGSSFTNRSARRGAGQPWSPRSGRVALGFQVPRAYEPWDLPLPAPQVCQPTAPLTPPPDSTAAPPGSLAHT